MTIKFDTAEARKEAFVTVRDANDIFIGDTPEGHLVMATYDVANGTLNVKTYINEEKGMYEKVYINSEGNIVTTETAFDEVED